MTVDDLESSAAPPARELPQTRLRRSTDRRLLDEVLAHRRVTRAELSLSTGISKPTISESVRRLVAGGLLDATGPQETGRRGRIGTFYELGSAAGWVLAIELDQAGVQAWSADLAGRVLARHGRPPGIPGDSEALAAALRAVVGSAVAAAGGLGPLRAVAVSVANPVDPVTHEVIPLAGSPFPEGLVNPAAILADLVRAPVLVDNDVNLAALAEHRTGAAVGAASFALVHIGAGLGVGLYLGDRLVRGAHGLAGEIGYLPGAGADILADDLAAGGLGRPHAPSIDVEAAIALLDRAVGTPHGDSLDRARQALEVLTAATARAVASVAAVVDPELIVLGGPVGSHPALLPPVRETLAATFPAPTRLVPATLGALAPLHGAVELALRHARSSAVADLGST